MRFALKNYRMIRFFLGSEYDKSTVWCALVSELQGKARPTRPHISTRMAYAIPSARRSIRSIHHYNRPKMDAAAPSTLLDASSRRG